MAGTSTVAKSKAFKRTNVPVGERIISIGILVLLGVIGLAIWIQGRHFDPNLYSLRTDALKSTVAIVTGKAATLSGETEGRIATPVVTAAGEPLEIKMDGLTPQGPTEFYKPENLFEKIDGRAPAYLGFNFQQLRCRSFTVAGAAGRFIDVFEFRMDTPINAFGMFALERDPDGKPLAFVADGYASEMGLFFRQGACYVQVIASDRDEKTMVLARAIAENRTQKLPVDDAGLAGRRRLPATGLLPETVAYIQENAQGQAFLKDVFQATYQYDGKKLPFFVMLTSPTNSVAGWQSYRTFSKRFGKVEGLPDVNKAQLFQAESFGTWKVIYQRDGELGGVFDAEDAVTARRFVEQYLQGNIR